MNVRLNWQSPLQIPELTDAKIRRFLQELESDPGIYIFGRAWGTGFEPLYVGQAKNICSRVKQQFNNRRLMTHVENAKTGKRVLYVAYLETTGRQDLVKALEVAERSLIRRFVSDGYDLHNTRGTKIRLHEIVSEGTRPRGAVPLKLMVEQ